MNLKTKTKFRSELYIEFKNKNKINPEEAGGKN